MKNENKDKFAISEFTGGQLNDLVKKLGGPEIVWKILCDYFIPKIEMMSLRLMVDYRINIGYRDPHIKRRCFQTKRSGKKNVEMALFRFDGKKMSTKDVLAEMEKYGYRPADLHEAVVFDRQYHDKRHEDHVLVALDSILMGETYQDNVSEGFFPKGDGIIPYLDKDSCSMSVQGYCCETCEHSFRNYCEYLGVRK